MLSSDLHPLEANSLMDRISSQKITSLSEVQLENVPLRITLRVEGRQTRSREERCTNAAGPISVIPSGRFNSLSEVQPENASSPILRMVEGR